MLCADSVSSDNSRQFFFRIFGTTNLWHFLLPHSRLLLLNFYFWKRVWVFSHVSTKYWCFPYMFLFHKILRFRLAILEPSRIYNLIYCISNSVLLVASLILLNHCKFPKCYDQVCRHISLLVKEDCTVLKNYSCFGG